MLASKCGIRMNEIQFEFSSQGKLIKTNFECQATHLEEKIFNVTSINTNSRVCVIEDDVTNSVITASIESNYPTNHIIN